MLTTLQGRLHHTPRNAARASPPGGPGPKQKQTPHASPNMHRASPKYTHRTIDGDVFTGGANSTAAAVAAVAIKPACPPPDDTRTLEEVFRKLEEKRTGWVSETAVVERQEAKEALEQAKVQEEVANAIACDATLRALVARLVRASVISKTRRSLSSLPSLGICSAVTAALGYHRPTFLETFNAAPGSGRRGSVSDPVASAVEAIAARAVAGDFACLWLLDKADVSTVADPEAMVRIGFLHAWGRLLVGMDVPPLSASAALSFTNAATTTTYAPSWYTEAAQTRRLSQEPDSFDTSGEVGSTSSDHSTLVTPIAPATPSTPTSLPSMKAKPEAAAQQHMLQRAIGWFRKAALTGDGSAMVSLGRLLISSGEDPGSGVTWLIKSWSAMRRRDPHVAAILSQCYGWKIGVLKADVGKALEWLMRCYEADEVGSASRTETALAVATMFETGRCFDRRDLIGWDDLPCVFLAPRRPGLAAGSGGISEDKAIVDKNLAWHWYFKASELGSEVAERRLETLPPPISQVMAYFGHV